MGFSGHIIVARTGSAYSGDAAPVLWEHERSDGWWWIQFDGDAPGVLSELVSATGQPAITASVLDSDVAEVEALTPAGQSWRAYLHPDTAAAYEAPPLPQTLDQIVESAIEWSAAAGLTPDAPAVRETLEATSTMVEDLFAELADALGVPDEEERPEEEG